MTVVIRNEKEVVVCQHLFSNVNTNIKFNYIKKLFIKLFKKKKQEMSLMDT